MDVVELIPRLRFLRFPVGHAYLWEDLDGLTLIDSGIPGSGPLIAEAIDGLGHAPADVRRLVLTHFHADHVGAAAEVVSWGGAEVFAHHADTPFIQGDAAGPPPDLADWERPLLEEAGTKMPASPPAPVHVDHELDDGDVLDFGSGARAVAVPGHTPAASPSTFPNRVCCSPATPWRAVTTGRSCSACSTPTRPRRPPLSGGWRPSTPRSPASATASRSPRTRQPNCAPPRADSPGSQPAVAAHGTERP
jgi:hypothetical protein